ncbi:MAG: UDP-N-acetylglucosamine 2-epimerase (non-hydrolyzing) [Candidatus Eisenbacteria bacterium]|nr:UDP-N-acetylglucosamine 2-epimerase (non-hydrolyzing) [Candidatus Eisenbacteria bacterium]
MKVFMVFGTRPEAIKMAPVVRAIDGADGLDGVVCVTAQHREMLAQVLKVFDITPQYDLDIMTEGQDLFDITTKSLSGLRNILGMEEPEIVLVQGDTTTAFAASLAAYYSKIAVGHVEAGLRTYDKLSPFPEEGMRHLIGVLADYHFAPTKRAMSNLLKEGVSKENIWLTGNTVVDALFHVRGRQDASGSGAEWERYFEEKWNLSCPSRFGDDGGRLVLVTGHRRESFGEGFENICMALKEIAERRRNVSIVYPVHLNPNVQGPVRRILGGQPNIYLIDPLDYEPFVYLMSRCYLVLTDSGGIQEEAPSIGKPVLVMRQKTERPEGVEAGTVKLVGTDKEKIVKETFRLFDDASLYERMSTAVNPYGDGRAAERIVEVLEERVLEDLRSGAERPARDRTKLGV